MAPISHDQVRSISAKNQLCKIGQHRDLSRGEISNPTVSANKKRPLKGAFFAETVVLEPSYSFEASPSGTLTEARAWREATRRKTNISALKVLVRCIF